ncbi:hypothetical protein SAMN05216436_11562 [bacterium A37T11]|nr:hypothetical protein SAMN05216436_11562 [bacterium A37T11]
MPGSGLRKITEPRYFRAHWFLVAAEDMPDFINRTSKNEPYQQTIC